MSCYSNAIKIFKQQAEREETEVEIPVEILNNVAALHFRLGNFQESAVHYKDALRKCNQEIEETQKSHFKCIQVSIRYNLGRLYEALHEFGKAIAIYKEILRDHSSYVDCYLRLGCIYRDLGQIYEASDWFKDALEAEKDHPDAWSLIGNLHLVKQEWGPGQKKFERILAQEATTEDTYSIVALGNVWLQTLYQSSRDKEKDRRHQERAIQMYRQALKIDPKNIYAANGIGCVLAHKGYINEARDVFSQVRESTADFPDVWINIAHIYVELKQYVNAIQMYENCHKRFFTHSNPEIMLYITRAHYKWGKMRQCKNILLKIRRVVPNDTLILFNLALVLQKLTATVLEDSKSSLQTVIQAVHELGLAHKYFGYLKIHGDKSKFDLSWASVEEQRCQDLLSQAQYHVVRARRADEEEQEIRRKQELEREALRQKYMIELKAKEEAKLQQEKELIQKRQEYVEKTKNIKNIFEVTEEKPRKTKHRKSNVEDGFVTDSSSNIDEKIEKSGRKKKHSEDGKEKRRRRKKRQDSGSESDGEVDDEEKKRRREQRKMRKKKDSESRKRKQNEEKEQSGKFKSKAYISSSSGESSEGEAGEYDKSQSAARANFESDDQQSDKSSGSDGSNAKPEKSKPSGRSRVRKYSSSSDQSSSREHNDSNDENAGSPEGKKKTQTSQKRKILSDDDDSDRETDQKKKKTVIGDSSDDSSSDDQTEERRKNKSDSEVERSPVNSDSGNEKESINGSD